MNITAGSEVSLLFVSRCGEYSVGGVKECYNICDL